MEDHVRALALVARSGRPRESYNIGGEAECSNLTLVETICDVLDQRRLGAAGISHRDLITFVTDRPGHDRRYGLDIRKIRIELGWAPTYTLKTGLESTIDWYLHNSWWWRPIREKRYQGARLGLERAQSSALPHRASQATIAPIFGG